MQSFSPSQQTRSTNAQRTLWHQRILPWMFRNSPCIRRSMESANNDKISGHDIIGCSQERERRPIQLHYPSACMYRRLFQNPKPFLKAKNQALHKQSNEEQKQRKQHLVENTIPTQLNTKHMSHKVKTYQTTFLSNNNNAET